MKTTAARTILMKSSLRTTRITTILSLETRGIEIFSKIKYNNHLISTSTLVAKNYVYSISTICNDNFISKVINNSSTDYYTQSEFVHKSAISNLALVKGLPNDLITIKKGSDQVPHFINDRKSMDIDLTLTHHGMFGAYAFSL